MSYVRYLTVPKKLGSRSNYLVITAETIIDLQDAVDDGVTSKEIVSWLKDASKRADMGED